jgi:hypothetical protein
MNMRAWLIGVLFLVCAGAVQAASADSSVVFRARFLNHEQQSYRVSQLNYVLNGTDTVQSERVSYKAVVYVEDSTADAYLLSWRLFDFQTDSKDKDIQALIRMAAPIRISYRTTPSGAFSEFISGDKVTQCLEKALASVLDSLKGRTSAEAKAASGRIYELRDNLETLILGSIVQFHSFMGLGYVLGEVVDVPVEITSRYSSKPLPATVRKKLVSLHPEYGTAEMAYATVIDASGLRKALAENLQSALSNYRSLTQIGIGSACIDYGTGWPLWMVDQREAGAGGKKYGQQIDLQYLTTSNIQKP